MRPALVACLVALVVLAGCPATVGEGAPDRTVTPAPVPTTTTQYPPGVTDRGVSGPELAAAHEHALERTNYTLVIRQRVVGPNGTVRRIDQTRRVLAGGESFAGRYRRFATGLSLVGSTGTVEYWTDGERFGARIAESEQVVYLGGSDTGQFITDIDGARWIERTAGALRFAVTESSPGTVALVVTGSSHPQTLPMPAYVHDPHNVSGTLRVRSDGLVTDWRLAYDANLSGRPVRVTHEAHVRDLGSTAVERPAWVDGTGTRSGA